MDFCPDAASYASSYTLPLHLMQKHFCIYFKGSYIDAIIACLRTKLHVLSMRLVLAHTYFYSQAGEKRLRLHHTTNLDNLSPTPRVPIYLRRDSSIGFVLELWKGQSTETSHAMLIIQITNTRFDVSYLGEMKTSEPGSILCLT